MPNDNIFIEPLSLDLQDIGILPPPEVLSNIASFLSPQDYFTFAMTSRQHLLSITDYFHFKKLQEPFIKTHGRINNYFGFCTIWNMLIAHLTSSQLKLISEETKAIYHIIQRKAVSLAVKYYLTQQQVIEQLEQLKKDDNPLFFEQDFGFYENFTEVINNGPKCFKLIEILKNIKHLLVQLRNWLDENTTTWLTYRQKNCLEIIIHIMACITWSLALRVAKPFPEAFKKINVFSYEDYDLFLFNYNKSNSHLFNKTVFFQCDGSMQCFYLTETLYPLYNCKSKADKFYSYSDPLISCFLKDTQDGCLIPTVVTKEFTSRGFYSNKPLEYKENEILPTKSEAWLAAHVAAISIDAAKERIKSLTKFIKADSEKYVAPITISL